MRTWAGQRVDRPGAFVEATVLTDVTPEMRAYNEELFGPAAVVYRVAGRATRRSSWPTTPRSASAGVVFTATPRKA